MSALAWPDTIFWANRFGEYCNEERTDWPGNEVIDDIVDKNYGASETCHVASCDGVIGILIEWEFAEGCTISPAENAHWRMVEVDHQSNFVWGGEDAPSYDGRWCYCIFIPAEYADRDIVAEAVRRIYRWVGVPA